MATVKIEGVREVTAAATALKAVDRDTRLQAGRAVRGAAPNIWNESVVAKHARTRVDRAVFAGVNVRATANSVTMRAATSPAFDAARAYEFGDPDKTYVTYQRQGHPVRRRTQNQLPPPYRKGRVVHPAFRESIPRIMSLYVATVVRTIYDAWEKR